MTDNAAPRLSLLGSPHLRRADSRFDLPDAMPGYLVAYLANRGDWVAREELAALLWPQTADAEAQNNLRVNLTRLRPHLERWGLEPCLVAERRRLRLDVDADVASLRAAHARGDWTATAQAAGGRFLDGLSFRAFPVLGEWAQAEREALRGLWRDAVLRVAERVAPQEKLDLATRYLAGDPLDEDLLRVQLGALAALGRLADAQRTYAEFDARARAELGVGATMALAQYAFRLSGPDTSAAPVAAPAGGDEPLIGRATELKEIVQQVIDVPLVSVIGLGGIGKTRIARAVQAAVAARFADGTVWLSLIDVAHVARIARQLGEVLQVTAGPNRDPVAQVVEHIGERSMLLVLDNVEHLLGERAALIALIDGLLQGCPQLRCLVTSRETLRHPQERVVRLEALAVPPADAGTEALATAAVRLFVQQALRHSPTFDPRGAVEPLVQIARLAGGLPLALRIAAAWMRFLSCADIAAEIRRGLDALESAADGSAGVRATLARTWGRLAPSESSALAQLSVFVSPFSAQAAREVAHAPLPVLGSLVDRCLLLPAPEGGDDNRARFEMHPLVRALAAEHLATDPAAQRHTRDRHASYVARLCVRWLDFTRVDQKRAMAVMGGLLAETLTAWHWSVGAGRVDFIAQVARVIANYLAQKGRWEEGVALFTDAEQQLDPQHRSDLAALVEVGRARAGMLQQAGDTYGAEVAARRTLVWARARDDTFAVIRTANTLGLSLMDQGRYREAMDAIAEAHRLAGIEGERRLAATIGSNLALLHKLLGDFARAEELWRDVLAAERAAGVWSGAVIVLNNLGNLLRTLKRFDAALVPLDEALRLCDEHGFAAYRALVLVTTARVHRDSGRLELATAFAERGLAEARLAGRGQLHTASLLVRAELLLQRPDLPRAARFLHDGLQRARIAGDSANQLAALDYYASWCEVLGRAREAVVARLLVLGHPKLDAELRYEMDERWQAGPPDPEILAEATQEAQRTDALALVERALAEWEQAAAPAADA